MKVVRVLVLFLTCSMSAFAADWKGITPLHSTKTDVLRILGASGIDKDGQTFYSGPDAIAVISYQTETCDSNGGKFGFGWNVPADTVSVIGVIPKEKIAKERVLGSLVPNKSSEGIFEYYSSPEGVRVETLDGRVTLITYLGTKAEDDKLRCQRVQTCCWDVFPRIDEFRPNKNADTRARISYLLWDVQLRGGRGVLVVSGPNRFVRKRRIASLTRLLTPVYKKIKIEPIRISIVDGGYEAEELITSNEYPIASEINWIMIPRKNDPEPTNKKKSKALKSNF